MGSTQLKKLFLKSFAALVVGIPLFVVSMLDKNEVIPGVNQWIWIAVGVLVFGVMWFAGSHFFVGAWSSFKAHNANMNTLVALATGPAWAYSFLVSIAPQWFPELARKVYYDAPMTVIGLLMLGAALEFIAGEKGSEEIRKLEKRLPKLATREVNGTKETISADKVHPSDVLFIEPGEIYPVDGVIQDKERDVFAGEKNGAEALYLQAKGSQSESRIKILLDKILQAQNSKPSIGRVADKISAIFAPIVIMIALITLLGWMNFGPSPQIAYMLVTFMAVLLIACPCALGLAAPISVSTGVGKAAQSGMIFHKGDAFEELSKIQEIVVLNNFDDLDEIRPELSKWRITITHAEELQEQDVMHYLDRLHREKKPYALVANEEVSTALLDKASLDIVMGPESYTIAADITVLRSSGEALLETIRISKATLRNIKQNLCGAFAYNFIAIPLAAGVLYPLTKTLLNPILAGALMASSSLVVILNANRLRFLKLKSGGKPA